MKCTQQEVEFVKCQYLLCHLSELLKTTIEVIRFSVMVILSVQVSKQAHRG